MRIAVAMTTAPRPRPTLDAAIASLRLAGGPVPLVVADRPDAPVGILATWHRALTTVAADTQANVWLLLQDDVTWPVHGWTRMRAALQDLWEIDGACGYASLYTGPRVHGALLDARRAGHADADPVAGGWYRSDRLQPFLSKGRWAGALAWVIPASVGRALLADRAFRRCCSTYTRSLDHHTTMALIRLGYRTYTLWPGLVSHELGSGNRAPRLMPRVREDGP
jgi:hypothetical protein